MLWNLFEGFLFCALHKRKEKKRVMKQMLRAALFYVELFPT